MSNKRLFLTASIVAIGLGGVALLSTSLSQPSYNFSQTKNINNAASIDTKKNAEIVIEDFDFENAIGLSTSDLSISITKSSATPETQSYSVTFSSSILAYANRDGKVYVTITDPSFNPNEQETISDPDLRPRYPGAVYTITNVKTNNGLGESVVIPRTMARGTQFYIDIDTIYENAIDETNKANVNSIVIPNNIEYISENAFTGLTFPDVKIYCEADEKPEGWADNWTDCQNIVWGYTLTEEQEKIATYNVQSNRTFGNDRNFMLGYEDGDGRYYPLIMKYDLLDLSTNSVSEEYAVLPIDSGIRNYDVNSRYEGVGSSVGSSTYTKTIDIEMSESYQIQDDTIVFYGIYDAEREGPGKPYFPVTTNSYYAGAGVGYAMRENISDYITYEFDMSSSFQGFTSLSMNVDRVPGIYEKVKESTYETNKENIANGLMSIRYRFVNLNSMYYQITYEYNGELISVDVPINSDIPRYILSYEKGNYVSFLIENSTVGEGFNGSNIKEFSLVGLTISMDLFTTSGAIVSKSSISTRFGVIPVIRTGTMVVPEDKSTDSGTTNYYFDSVNFYNGDLVLILTCVIFAIVFALGAVGLFLYMRHKFRNDEFRRVKPKKFIKSAITLFAGMLTVILAIIFIYFRSVPFNNAIVVFNPVDIYVIVFAIASVLFIGYYIRYLLITVKAERERRRVIKLKLDESSDDDGTK